MKIKEPIMGFAEYTSKEYPFIYENGIMKLMPASVQAWSREKHNLLESMANWGKNVYYSTEWIGFSHIKAKSHDEDNVIFCISNEPSNNNGFISFSVLYFYKYRNTVDEKSIDGFFVTGREVNDFLDPARVFDTQIIFENHKILSTDVNIKRENELVLGSYKYQGVDITISINAIPTFHPRSDIPLSAQSKIKFAFSETQNLDFTINIFEQCRKFFFYICGRTNIQFDDIHIYSSTHNNAGIIRLVSEYVAEETDIKRPEKIIKYEYLKEKTCLLFSAIAEDTMYFENLCSSIQATHSFGTARIILNFVAFEREFRNLYGDDIIVRSDEYKEVKDNILQYLESTKEKNTGKKRKYIISFIKSIEKTENKYGTKMAKALLDCEEILLPFLQHNYKNYKTDMIEEISNRMNKLRNDSAHGNIDLQIDPIHISDFATLENLLYAMRLKRIGVELMDIRKSIKDLKNYNLRIGDSI